MPTSTRKSRRARSSARRLAILLALAASVTVNGCMHMSRADVTRPSSDAFGLGPRLSARLAYRAVIDPQEPLAIGRLQRAVVRVTDADGGNVDGATITIDGGMPEHGHGLPTRPRVTANLGGGVYQVEGLKFNMGGWWELRFAISAAAGTDTVTFNVAL